METVSRANQQEKSTAVRVADIVIGGKEIVLMGGPCAVESREQMKEAAKVVKMAGGRVLRGGVFKPRSSPYSFQGLGKEGLDYLVEAAKDLGLLTITEIVDEYSLGLISERVDIIQIGARNMQNFQLLKAAGKIKKPIVLKRGFAATVKEWLLASEYILYEGNPDVILCERGIRTYETSTRNTLDISSVMVAKSYSKLSVIVDPSHAAGRADLVPALARAAIAVGADGLLIEMHPNPSEAKSDGDQSLTPTDFLAMASHFKAIATSVGRTFCPLESPVNLNSLRTKIDLIDEQLIKLLADRLRIATDIIEHKSSDRIRDSKRENEIIKKLTEFATELDLSPELIKQIYPIIFDFCIQAQLKRKTINHTNCIERI